MELYKLTGGELHRLMKEKKVSAVEVTEDIFARIAKVENGRFHYRHSGGSNENGPSGG